MIRVEAPDLYAMVLAQTADVIQIDGGTWSAPSGRRIALSLPWMVNRPYGASLIVHEATHIRSFWAGLAWRGCDGEAIALIAQADFLERAGRPDLAAYARGLIGTWC